MRDDEYFAIKDRAAAVLLKIPHVIGVGMGGRERNGQPTGEIVLKVFVRRKKPRSDVPPDEVIPASFEGVTTDVVEMGLPVPGAPVPGAVVDFDPSKLPIVDDARTDPMEGGMNFAVRLTIPAGAGFPAKLSQGVGGTIGCLLKDKNDASAVYALTNQHCLVPKENPRLSRSRPAVQEAVAGAPDRADTFGIVAGGGRNKSRDAGVIRLKAGQEWQPSIKDIGFVKGTHTVTVAEAATQTYQVRKRGAKTGVTGGVVTAINARFGHGLFELFTDLNFQMVIKPNPAAPTFPQTQQVFFFFEGDSGSVAVNEDNEVVALLWGRDGDLSKQFINCLGNSIDLVLKQFKDVEKLDLEVAVPDNANPTQVQRVIEPAGAPRRTTADTLAFSDSSHLRPLVGGSQILAAPLLGTMSATTMGCVVTKAGAPGTAYILTSFSGVSANGSRPPTTDTDIGQPDNDSSCSGCCSSTVGKFFRGGPDQNVLPAALVKLKEDQKWVAELLQIGMITKDTAEVQAAEVASGTYSVRKYGAGTRLTGGVVVAIGGVHGVLPGGVRPDSMLIRPHPNPLRPSQDICFSHFLDRGAVVVNNDNRIVGLLYDEVDLPGAGAQRIIHGVATPIRIAIDLLNALGGISVEVAHTELIDEVRTTINRIANTDDASTPPIVAVRPEPRGEVPALPVTRPELVEALEWLQDELSETSQGRLAMAFWNEHRTEIRHLVAHNRKVATAWHRSGGPALLQALVRAFQVPSTVLPTTVNGRPIAGCIDRLARVVSRYASPGLQTDVERLHAVLPPIGGRSIAELILSLDQA